MEDAPEPAVGEEVGHPEVATPLVPSGARRASASAPKPDPTGVEAFDVFDTVLTRRILHPEALFHVLGRRLERTGLIDHPAEVFARTRRAAETRCRARMGVRMNIFDIYAELTRSLLIDEGRIEELARQEFGLEKEMTRTVPEGLSLLESAREAGRKIVFVSDMHYPAAMLRELLAHHGVARGPDGIYVSCDSGLNKTAGTIFAHVARSEGVRPGAVRFHGNDPWSDVRMAARAGFRPRPLPVANPNRYEEILGDHADHTAGLSGLFAGASRAARLTVPARDLHEATLRDVTAGVAGPLLVSYVIWMLEKARRLGLTRLYFLARDGQILQAIAERIKGKLGLDIDCRYLYASRLSWARTVDDGGVRFWVFGDIVAETTPRDLLARLSMKPEDVEDLLARIDLTPDTWETGLSAQDVERSKLLFASSEFQDRIERVRAEHRSLLLRYLDQEGMFDAEPKAIVDTGWNGVLHETLSILLSAEGVPPVPGLFFGLREYATPFTHLRHSFHFDQGRNQGPHDPLGSDGLPTLLECFAAADHGTVCGFEERDGTIVPRLADGWTEIVNAWGLPVITRTIEAFATELSLRSDDARSIGTMDLPIQEIVRAFWLSPTPEEARSWGGFPWDAGQGSENAIVRLAEPYRATDALAYLARGTRVLRKHRDMWVEASLRMSPWAVRSLLGFEGRLCRFAKRVKNRMLGGLRRGD